jgi:hypothetical protein
VRTPELRVSSKLQRKAIVALLATMEVFCLLAPSCGGGGGGGNSGPPPNFNDRGFDLA